VGIVNCKWYGIWGSQEIGKTGPYNMGIKLTGIVYLHRIRRSRHKVTGTQGISTGSPLQQFSQATQTTIIGPSNRRLLL
jgi:hypothetical protein